MPTCFVIQPFDRGKFDKRFEDVYQPAILEAGLEAYRVDKDPSADVPIEAIESGIRKATICLADISKDNPNVWYELGFAFAAARPVIMVCDEERKDKKFPFDIQHRAIITYSTESAQDFQKLKVEITKRMLAQLQKVDTLEAIRNNETIAPVHGLSQIELVVLATVAGSASTPFESVSVYIVKREVENAAITSLGFSLGLKRLVDKELVDLHTVVESDGEYSALSVTDKGWKWIEQNEHQFILSKKRPAAEPDDIPF